jgi:DNA-binding transcriptional ArsR family regulator
MARSGDSSRVGVAASPPQLGPSEVFKALGDPVRWSIICQAADVEELAASVLEDTLDVSKPTISYHTKILVQAGLLSPRKHGRNFFYTLQREVLHALVEDVWSLAPEPRPVRDGAPAFRSTSTRRRRSPAGKQAETAEPGAALLTW